MSERLETLRAELPEYARDIKLNLQAVLTDGVLAPATRWGVAIAAAKAARNQRLLEAVVGDARAVVDDAVVEDALAAAVLMAMSNVYYRFRHLVGKDAYQKRPARLRMNRIARPATTSAEFELYCLAVSAINGCEACIRAHEKAVVDAGLGEDAVHDAIRIAATIHAAAVAVERAID